MQDLIKAFPVQVSMLRKWKETVRKLKEDVYTLYLASRDPRIPFIAKVVLVITVAYAFSPIDLIPDFIPVIGYLDDLLLLPLGIWLSIRLIPEPVLHHYRQKAKEQMMQRKPNYIMAAVIVIIWLLVGYWAYQAYMDQID
ncbi:YkvA family protein [Pontibacter sp. MBLB2868]|uniref:YkvA family protein n=1 Tax=Pontibacter sp. MBLB2868 TaxID=3451555 RepID=UPI003F75601D